MEIYVFLSFLICFFIHGVCESTIPIGYRVTIPVPSEYSSGFVGRALIMEKGQTVPTFKVAFCVEAINGRYTCSLEVFLGNTRVWSSGHFWRFYPLEKCVLELTHSGVLQLLGSGEQIGWQTGTSGQGVERLQILRTGNLVLLDAWNRIKWRSFDFPTDILLKGQRLSVSTRLTSFIGNSTSYYSFEVQINKIALYLNSGNLKYSYWEFKPPNSKNITFVGLGSTGLKLFDTRYKKIGQIPTSRTEPLKFLALGNKTGNLGLYHYSPYKWNFEASFQALNTTCDLPLACESYGICTFSNTCTCIELSTPADPNYMVSNCYKGFTGRICDVSAVEMVELEGVNCILKGIPQEVNISKEECASLCMKNCTCVAALYSARECFLYGFVSGLKQVEKGTGPSYYIKVPKGAGGHGKTSSMRKWLLIMAMVVDVLVILLFVGGFVYYFFVFRKKRKDLPQASDNTRTDMDSLN